jgi:broad specificity phosphatase PhoE
MATLDIRRHAQRRDLADSQSALSAAGREMCDRLAKVAPRYALVVSSPLPRAKETAERIGGRLDGIDPGLLPDIAQGITERRTLADWAALLRDQEDARRFAEEQLPVWSRIASRLEEKQTALAVSHGGIIDLPAVLLAQHLGTSLGGPAFGYCEGVRVTYAKGAPAKVEVLRV